MRLQRLVVMVVLSVVMVSGVSAHPVIWKDGHALMLSDAEGLRNSMYHYSFNYNWALGVQRLFLKDRDESYAFGQSNWLLTRWNAPESQGNLYLMSGLGLSDGPDVYAPLVYLGGQADWETRWIYTFFRADYYSLDTSRLSLRARIGVAPYAGGFDDVHTWLIAEVSDVLLGGVHRVSVMPVVRIFKDSFLVEFGSDFSGHTMIVAMLHF